jgi:PKD repeat protein
MRPISKVLILSCILFAACKKRSDQAEPTQEVTKADFSWTGAKPAPEGVTFKNESTSADTFKWDFGNGITSKQHTPYLIIYNKAGTYTVNLMAKGASGSSLTSKTIVISDDQLPRAYFTYSFSAGRSAAPAKVDFQNASINADRYDWDINGIRYTTQNPGTVLFKQAGNYKVKLIARKGNTSSPVYEDNIEIVKSDLPIAKFVLNYHPYPYSVNEEIQFINKSENSDSWEWTFGPDVTSTTNEHPVVKFPTNGIYPITLIAKKDGKQSTAYVINLKIGK